MISTFFFIKTLNVFILLKSIMVRKHLRNCLKNGCKWEVNVTSS